MTTQEKSQFLFTAMCCNTHTVSSVLRQQRPSFTHAWGRRCARARVVWPAPRRRNTLCGNKLICWFNRETVWMAAWEQWSPTRRSPGVWETINKFKRRSSSFGTGSFAGIRIFILNMNKYKYENIQQNINHWIISSVLCLGGFAKREWILFVATQKQVQSNSRQS